LTPAVAMPVMAAVPCTPAVPGTVTVTVVAVPKVGEPGVEPLEAGQAVCASRMNVPDVAVAAV
jgi:hypothetical protein